VKHSLKFQTIREMAYISLAAVLIAVCAWIVVPAAVPFTMQTFAVYLILDLLGAKRGAVCLVVYLAMGCIGLPVFSGGSSGFGILLGNTGGYMIGWLMSAAISFGFEKFGRGTKISRIAAMACGLGVCYLFGSVWFTALYTLKGGDIGFWGALMMCVLPFVIPDAVKLVLAFTVSCRLKRILRL